MLGLHFATSRDWVPLALENLDQILVEQAHLEKKAAGAALSLLFRYPDAAPLQAPLAELAREELAHFLRMLEVLRARGLTLARVRPLPYAERLVAVCRGEEPGRMLDSMLCCAVIEARSCERMKLLAESLRERDRALADLYADLVRSEATHHATYLSLCEELFPRAVVRGRLDEILAHERAVLASDRPQARLHG